MHLLLEIISVDKLSSLVFDEIMKKYLFSALPLTFAVSVYVINMQHQ